MIFLPVQHHEDAVTCLIKYRDKHVVVVCLWSVWLLMQVLEASTVEACRICRGKLFHVSIVLDKKLYLGAPYLTIRILLFWPMRKV